MLTHQVGAVVHQLDRVQGAASLPGAGRGVGRLPEKLHGEIVHGQRALVAHLGLPARMPFENCVQPVKHARLGHVDLADPGLLCRSAEKFERPVEPVLLHDRLQCQRGAHAARAEQIVSAAVSGSDAVLARAALRNRFIAHAGKRIVLGQDADDRCARAVAGDKGRRHARHLPLDREARFLQRSSQERSGAILPQRGLGIVPQLNGQAVDCRPQRFDRAQRRLLRTVLLLRQNKAANQQHHRQTTQRSFHLDAPAQLPCIKHQFSPNRKH